MRKLFGLSAAAAVLLAATPALACTPFSERIVVREKDVGENLIRNAVTIELAVAESAQPLEGVTAPGGRPSEITFRVQKRLKGVGTETFKLKGVVVEAASPKLRPGDYSEARDVWRSGDATTALEPGALDGPCKAALPAVIGARYLVFRGADGRLLGPTIPFRWRGTSMDFMTVGPVYEAAPDDDDAWLVRIRKTLMRLNG